MSMAMYGQRVDNSPSTASKPGTVPQIPDPSAAYRITENYKISPHDLLDIYIVDAPEFSRDYRVAPNGTIRLPLLSEEIMAAGQSLASLGVLISNKLSESGLLNKPPVLVEVKEARMNTVSVTGEVKNPQNVQMVGSTTLMNVLSQAGGLGENASNTAIVRRREAAEQPPQQSSTGSQEAGTGEAVITVDLTALLKGDASQNITLYPGDAVVVQRAATIYVVGAVNRPGAYLIKGEPNSVTAMKYLMQAGDVTAYASPDKAYIIRKNSVGSQTTEEIPLNLKKIVTSRAPDKQLLAEDILYVPDSNMKKAIHRAGEAAAQAATVLTYGLAIYK